MKKLLLSAGALATAITPIIAVVSCSGDGEKPNGSENSGNGDNTGGNDGGTTPGDGDGGTTPGDGDGGTTPGDGDGGTTPGDGDGGTTPGDGDGGTTPGDGDGGTTPGDGDGGTTPGDGDGGTTPGDGDGETTPGDVQTIKINLEDFSQPQDLIDELDKTVKFSMHNENDEPVDASLLGGALIDSTEKYEAIKNYVKGINTLAKFELSFNEETYIMDFSGLKPISDQIISILDTYTYSTLPLKVTDLTANLFGFLGKTMPEMSAYAAYTSGAMYSIGMLGFLRISEMNIDNEEDKVSYIIEHSEYLNLLREWHKISWSFTQSSIYNAWINDSTSEQKYFNLGIAYNNTDEIDGFLSENILPGALFDLDSAFDDINWSNGGAIPESHTVNGEEIYELSNFEALLLQNILNLDLVTNFG